VKHTMVFWGDADIKNGGGRLLKDLSEKYYDEKEKKSGRTIKAEGGRYTKDGNPSTGTLCRWNAQARALVPRGGTLRLKVRANPRERRALQATKSVADLGIRGKDLCETGLFDGLGKN